MARVIVVKSWDGHPTGAMIPVTDAQAAGAVIQRRAVLVPDGVKTLRVELHENFEGQESGTVADLDLGVAAVLLGRGAATAVAQPDAEVKPKKKTKAKTKAKTKM